MAQHSSVLTSHPHSSSPYHGPRHHLALYRLLLAKVRPPQSLAVMFSLFNSLLAHLSCMFRASRYESSPLICVRLLIFTRFDSNRVMTDCYLQRVFFFYFYFIGVDSFGSDSFFGVSHILGVTRVYLVHLDVTVPCYPL